eukprot:6488550-Amphidinium_carterae.2
MKFKTGLLDASLLKALKAAVLSLRTCSPQCWVRKCLLQRRSATNRHRASTVAWAAQSPMLIDRQEQSSSSKGLEKYSSGLPEEWQSTEPKPQGDASQSKMNCELTDHRGTLDTAGVTRKSSLQKVSGRATLLVATRQDLSRLSDLLRRLISSDPEATSLEADVSTAYKMLTAHLARGSTPAAHESLPVRDLKRRRPTIEVGDEQHLVHTNGL